MIEADEPYSERVTFRLRPRELRRLDAAARASGVSRSRIVREGGLRVARQVLRQAAGEDGGNER